MPLNVIVVNDYMSLNGGATAVAISTACDLSRRGHRVIFFGARGPIAPELSQAGVTCVQIMNPRDNRARVVVKNPIKSLWNRRARLELRKVLGEFSSVDTVVHLHGWASELSSSVVREAVERGFKVILTVHDYFLACPTGDFFNYKQKKICRLIPYSKSCLTSNCDSRNFAIKQFRVVRHAVQKYYGLIPNGINGVIFVSDFGQRILQPYLSKKSLAFNISNPVDLDKREPATIEPRSPFVFVGRFAEHKGAALLARASCQVKNDVVFIGDGPERAEIIRIAPNAKILGWRSKSEVYKEMRAARALILPSLCYESQPLVVLEAAAIGVPSIVPDQSAASNMVVDGVTGLLFRYGDVDSLVRQMNKLCDTELARKLGLAAFNRYWNGPSVKYLENLETCYLHVLKNSPET